MSRDDLHRRDRVITGFEFRRPADDGCNKGGIDVPGSRRSLPVVRHPSTHSF